MKIVTPPHHLQIQTKYNNFQCDIFFLSSCSPFKTLPTFLQYFNAFYRAFIFKFQPNKAIMRKHYRQRLMYPFASMLTLSCFKYSSKVFSIYLT